MKRWICIVLILTWLVCLSGCTQQDEQLQKPVRFYYPRSSPSYGSADSVIGWEEREAAGHTDDHLYLLRQYMKGPESDDFSRIFPRNAAVKDLQITGNTAYVMLNEYAAMLTGLELTIACACLTATVTELTGVARVTIHAENALLDGDPSITMDWDQILLLDENAAKDAN